MADILISYASVDRPFAHRLAEALEAVGWTVWWDHRNLRGGQHFDRVIEEAISDAGVVIVVWSRNSIESGWVRDEATLALEKEKLLPLRMDMARPPMGFRNIHTIDLSSWTGESGAEPFERLVGDLRHYLGPPNSSDRGEQSGTRAEPTLQAAPTDIPGRGSVSGNQQPPASVGDAAIIAQVAYGRGDFATALSIARPASERGDPTAQLILGLLYANGRGVPLDYPESMRWLRKLPGRTLRMCCSAVRTASPSGWRIGGSACGIRRLRRLTSSGLTPHDLRHTSASLAIGSGASVKHVQRMLGHKDAAMTLNVYASLFEDDLDDVSERLDAALREAAAACVRPDAIRKVIDIPGATAGTGT